MKKQVFYTLAATVLLSSSLLSTLNVQADETEPTKDSATSTAKISFTGGNDDPVDPLIPDNPDDHGTGDHGPLSIDHVSEISLSVHKRSQQVSKFIMQKIQKPMSKSLINAG